MSSGPGFKRETVRIPSVEEGIELDVWLYIPVLDSDKSGLEGEGEKLELKPPYPVVIAGHGLTVTKAAGLSAFGENWATHARWASLILDYRGFGDSDPQDQSKRNLVTLDRQDEDYSAVLRWARARPALFRADKIVLMGSALSALSVARLVLEDRTLAGGMAHSPLLDGYATLTAGPANPRLLFWAFVDWARSKIGLGPVFVKCIGKPGEFSMLNSPSCEPGFQFMFAQNPSGSTPFSSAPNLVTPRLAFELLSSRGRVGRKLKDAKCPLLFVYAHDDDMIPPAVTRSVVEDARAGGAEVKLVEAPGGHFDIMKGGKGFEVNINAQVDFLRSLC